MDTFKRLKVVNFQYFYIYTFIFIVIKYETLEK